MDASREGDDRKFLLSDIEDLDLSLRHTTAVARLDVRLVLAITRALPRTCSTLVSPDICPNHIACKPFHPTLANPGTKF